MVTQTPASDPPAIDPPAAIEALRDADARLEDAVRAASAETGLGPLIARDSRLPGWTVGHVLSHLARNADGLRNVLQGAVDGELRRPYASPEARAQAIEEGARRDPAVIADDFAAATARFDAAVAGVPDEVWSATVDLGRGGPTTADVLLAARLAEVELHHDDLAVDGGLAELDDSQAERLLHALRRSYVRTRDVPGMRLELDAGSAVDLAGGGPRVAGRVHDVVAWLAGRSDGASLRADGPLPELPPW